MVKRSRINRAISIPFIVFFLFFNTHIFAKNTSANINKAISKITKSYTGDFGIYIKDLKTNKELSKNATTLFYLSSVIKLFVLIETYNQIESQKINIYQKIKLKKSDYRDGSTKIFYLKEGTKISIKRLLEYMIIYSDNAATDILINLIGTHNLNKTLKLLGYSGPQPITSMLQVRKRIWANLNKKAWNLSPANYINLWQNKKFEKKLRIFEKLIGMPSNTYSSKDLINAYKAFYSENFNSTTLKSVGSILEKLWLGKIISQKASVQMLKLLRKCQTGKERLRAGFPKRTLFFHKTGTQFRTSCNVGIAYKERKANFIIAFCARNYLSQYKTDLLMKEIGKIAFKNFSH